jgi:membrane-bound serine protease (ClpP class)
VRNLVGPNPRSIGEKMENVNRGRAAALLLGMSVILAAGARAAVADSAGPARTILSMKLAGVVDPFEASYIRRGISTAESRGDVAVLITIDTPGGLDSSMREIIQAILASKLPVICYTAPSGARAASAGTFIMQACPVNAMAPGTEIGAAHPVGVSGAIESEKVTNDAAAYIRSLAQRWGRNADWAEQAVRNAVSLPADQALSTHVVDIVAPSTSALIGAIGDCGAGGLALPTRLSTGLLRDGAIPAVCGASVAAFGMSWGEGLFHSLADPNVAFLLLNIGFLALIAWVFHPGFHLSLAVGVISTVLGLVILETLPVRLTGLVLLAIAAILFVLDVKAKAHGVLTAGGIAVLVLGGLLLFNPSVPNAHVSLALIIAVAAAFTLFSVTALRAMLRATEQPVQMGLEGLTGATGVATTALDPAGTARVNDEAWTAEAVSGTIGAGTAVRVVSVRGLKLMVEAAVASGRAEAEGGAHDELSAAGTSPASEREGS